MSRKFVIANLRELNSHPSAWTDVGRPVIAGRVQADEFFLYSWLGGNQYCHMTVIVMVVRKRRKHPFLSEKRRLAMR